MAESFDQIVRSLRAAAEPTRLRLLALCAAGEASVSELAQALGQSQPRVSRHLKLLCDAGLLERFRDGHYVYYRAPAGARAGAMTRRLLALLPDDAEPLVRDAARVAAVRAAEHAGEPVPAADPAERALNRAVIASLLGRAVGSLLDIGAGEGHVLTLLGRSASRAVGVEIDAAKRRRSRHRLAAAGLANCSIRAGDMYRLPFDDGEFDTVVVDEVLGGAERPAAALAEAVRVLRPQGRLLVVLGVGADDRDRAARQLKALAAAAGLRCGPLRAVPSRDPRWLVSVATPIAGSEAAA